MLRLIASILIRPTQWAGDQVAQSTGWVALRIPLERARGKHAVTLPLPGYMQISSYGCGGVAAAMAARCVRPDLEFGAVYNAINPLPELGAGTRRVVQGLRVCGLRVSLKKDLTFARLARCINQGWPILVVIHNPGSASRHWVVVYGYSRDPDLVYLASNGLPWLTRNGISRKEFETLWAPKGNGLVCARPSRRLSGRLARSQSK